MKCRHDLKFDRQVDVFPLRAGVLTGNYRLVPINQTTGFPDQLFPVIDSAQYQRRKAGTCKSCQPCKCLKKKFLRCNVCDC